MKSFLFAVSCLFSVVGLASGGVNPNEAARQSKSSVALESKVLASWLGKWTLTCTHQNKVTLIATVKNGSAVIKSTYGDAGELAQQSADATQVLQLQVADVITLLVSGPDADEGSALVILPGVFSETIGPKAAGFPVLKRSSAGTALVYGDVVGETGTIEPLACELQ